MTEPVTLHVVPHSHWDREWYRPFQSFRLRLVELVDTVLDLMETEDGWSHFMLDGQTATATDYLEARPEARARLSEHIRAGRIAVGPWHILMDEFLVSGETTIRNLELGRKLSSELGGVMPLGYLPDMFGHISQMPQILRLAGLEDAVVWRGVPLAIDRTAFTWEAPDGSTVRAVYMPQGYSNGAGLPTDPDELAFRTAKIRRDLEPFAPGSNLLVMCGTDHLFPTPGLPKALAAASDNVRYRIGSLTDYIAADRAAGSTLLRWKGELRSSARTNLLMGVISNRTDLRRLVGKAERELERHAEPLQALVAPHLARGLLDVAWRKLIENSAHDTVCACSVDEVTEQGKVRWQEAFQIAEGVSQRALGHLTRSVTAPPGPAFIVWNASPRPRSGVIEVELEVPPEWGDLVAVDAATGRRGAVMELSRNEPVALDLEVPVAMVVSAFDLVQGRRVGEEWVNGIEVPVISDERIEAVFRIDAVPRGQIDVEAELARMREIAAAHPRAMVSIQAFRPGRRRLLVEVSEIPQLGWATFAIGEGSTGLSSEAAPELDLDLPKVVDGGDVGDTYNYCWPENDDIVDASTVISDEKLEDSAFRRIRRLTVLHESVGEIVWTLRSSAGEGVVSIHMDWVNDKRDHRVRVHFPLPEPVVETQAGGPFSVDTRGLSAEGGPSEIGIPTFPARGALSAGPLFLVLPQVTEYEVVADGRELALTALRATATISRGPMASRPMPAGPDIATPAAQCPGPQSFAFGISGGDHLDSMEAYLCPLRAVPVHRTANGAMPSRQAGPLIEGPVVLSSCRRIDTGEIEVRIWNPLATEVEGGVRGGGKVDLVGREMPDSGVLRTQEIATYRLP